MTLVLFCSDRPITSVHNFFVCDKKYWLYLLFFRSSLKVINIIKIYEFSVLLLIQNNGQCSKNNPFHHDDIQHVVELAMIYICISENADIFLKRSKGKVPTLYVTCMYNVHMNVSSFTGSKTVRSGAGLRGLLFCFE